MNPGSLHPVTWATWERMFVNFILRGAEAMVKHINSNVSVEEFFKYHCTDENAVRFYDEIVKEESDLKRVIADLERRLELAEEQIYFAQNLLNGIVFKVQGYSNTAGATKLRKLILDEISESMFER
jgi:hypothetical protein